MNYGAFKCIDMVLPDDCWLNAKWPAPTIACTTHTAGKISSAIWQGLAKAVPERAVASTYSENNWFVANVRDPQTGTPIVISDLPTGGWGGTPEHDGIDNSSDPLGMCQSLAAEIAEMAHPVHWDRFEMRPDSGGPGKYRGGLGMILQFTPLGHMELSQESSRMKLGVWGVNGGGRSLVQYGLRKERDGTLTTVSGLDDQGQYHKSLLSNVPFPPGTSFIFAATGGGGWGDPLEREPERVLEDVLDEYVTIEGAEKDYGVVIDREKLEIDHEATRKLREKLGTSEEYRRHLQGVRRDYVKVKAV
jgi:N-methylhydantoinase B/oxoprolinase/acetone carboxylase alpha subunit